MSRKKLALQYDLDTKGAEMIGKHVAPPSRRTDRPVGEGRQSDNDACGRESLCGVRDQLSRRRRPVIGDDLERRHDPCAVVTDRQADAASARINPEVAHSPL